MSRTSKALLRLGVPGLAAVTLVAGIPAFLGTAQAAPIGTLSITPVDGNSTAAAGSCQAFFVTAGGATAGTSTVGEAVNVIITDNTGNATTDVSFCTAPTTVNGTTFTPQAGTAITTGGAQTGGGSSDQSRFTLGAGTTAAANNGRVVIGITRNAPTTGPTAAGTGAVSIQAYSDRNGNNAFNAGEPTDAVSANFTAGGPAGTNPNQDAVSVVEVIEPGDSATSTAAANDDTDRALAGEARTFIVGTSNGTDPVANAIVSFFISSTVSGSERSVGTFGTTNNDGIVTGTITFPTGPATDTVTFFVNQTAARTNNTSTPGLDAGEPRDTARVFVQSNAPQLNRSIVLTAQGDAGSSLNSTAGNSAVNFVGDTDRGFTAIIDDTRTTDAATSTAGTLVAFAVTGGSGDESVVVNTAQTPDGFTNECSTVNNAGTADTNDSFCTVTVNDPTPVSGQVLTVTATIRNTAVNSTGTLRFRGQPTDARFISVTPDSGETQTQSVRRFVATVTDANGRPVEGVLVTFSETGAGFFRSNDANGVITDVNGLANIETTSAANETGEEVVTGTIAPNQTASVPNVGTAVTGRQCAQGAGQGTNPTPNANGTFSAVAATVAAGNCSDTGRTNFVTTLSPSPSASTTASPSPSATSTVSPSPSAGTQAPRLGISVSPATITPGIQSVVTITGRPGTIVELQAYSRPSTTYTVVRRGTILENGTLIFRVVPGTNTRLFAAVTGQTGNESPSVVINVRTALSLTVVRNGSLDYTFQGRILPRRAGQLITLYRVLNDGREIITSQIRTDDSGTYRIRRVFVGQGTFGFLTRTGQTLTNAAGVSNEGRARPTSIYAGPQR